MSTVITRTVRTDAAGYYIEYTFDDGHVETQPPHRPLTKEDLQRQVRAKLALAASIGTLSAESAIASFNSSAMPTQDRARDVFDQLNGADATGPFSLAVDAMSTVAKTASVRPDRANSLTKVATLGGPAANEIAEFATIQQPINPGRTSRYSAAPYQVMAATREISGG